MSAPAPRVTVVVPTHRRPGLVGRAVASALAQTVADIEVIVAVDGPDPATSAVLDGIADPRLRVHVLARRSGNGAARNAAIALARAPLVAFLDDDDLWMPAKLERQLVVAGESDRDHPIVSCAFIGRTDHGDLLWPRRRPRPGEPVSEYLFRRSSPFSGEGIAQTSTLLTTRALMRALPFDERLPRYVDIDWMLRAGLHPGAGLEFVPGDEPLAVWSLDGAWARISTGADAEETLRFARVRRGLFTRRAYAGFLLWIASKNAAQARRRGAFAGLLWEAARDGRPGAADVVTHVANFAVPPGARDRIAARRAGARRAAA